MVGGWCRDGAPVQWEWNQKKLHQKDSLWDVSRRLGNISAGGDGRGSIWLSGIVAVRVARMGKCKRLRGIPAQPRSPPGVKVCMVRGVACSEWLPGDEWGHWQWKRRGKRREHVEGLDSKKASENISCLLQTMVQMNQLLLLPLPRMKLLCQSSKDRWPWTSWKVQRKGWAQDQIVN